MIDKTEIAIEVKSLSKKYYRTIRDDKKQLFFALNNVSFEIKKGDVVAIIGENGSGKSTLLKILSGVTKPTNGSAILNGRISSILDIGAGFHPDLSGKENLYLRGELLGMKKHEIKEVFSKIVDFSELNEFINTPVKHYSDGMFLRLAFSVIIFLKFDVLLLDEVMSVGDAHFRKKTEKKIMEMVSTENKTVLIVSHNLGSITSLATKYIYIEKGEIRNITNSHKIVKEYLKNSNSKLENITNCYESKVGYEFNNHTFKKIFFKGKNNNRFDYDEKIIVSSIISCEKSDSKFPFLLEISDCFSNVIFASSILIENPMFMIKKMNTQIEFTLEIPKKVLNFGIYSIGIYVIDDKNNIKVIKNNILEFEIAQNSNKFNKWFENTPAILKLPLKWDYTIL